MAEYRLYRFETGHIRSAEVLDCADDAEAIAHVQLVRDHEPMELWQATRLVRRFEPEPDADS